jgi:hypothetical protein
MFRGILLRPADPPPDFMRVLGVLCVLAVMGFVDFGLDFQKIFSVPLWLEPAS